jgi:hypothetical protein
MKATTASRPLPPSSPRSARRCAVSEIQATSIEDEDEEFGGAALLGEKGDTPLMTDPDGSVRICGEGGSLRSGDAGRRTEWEIGRVKTWRLMRG